MRRKLTAVAAAATLVMAFAGSTLGAHGGDPAVVVMQHICDADIQSEEDFVAIEDEGAGGEPGGEGTLPGLVATVLACPTVVNEGDTPTDGIAAPAAAFDYTVADSDGAAYELSADGAFMAAELCESDIALDVDDDGDMDDTTCLDVSMYGFSPAAEGEVTITQTQPVGDSRFGTIRFTPASTDEMTMLTAAAGVVTLDTTADTQVDEPPLPLDEYNDDVVVAHIYNFVGASTAPNTAMTGAAGAPYPAGIVLIAIGALLAGIAVVTRRSLASR